jgi:hypothetical protein
MDAEDNKMIVHALTPEKIFYNDLDEAAQEKWAAELKTFSYRCFYNKLTYIRWRDIPSTHFYCLQGQAILERDGVRLRSPISS